MGKKHASQYANFGWLPNCGESGNKFCDTFQNYNLSAVYRSDEEYICCRYYPYCRQQLHMPEQKGLHIWIQVYDLKTVFYSIMPAKLEYILRENNYFYVKKHIIRNISLTF